MGNIRNILNGFHDTTMYLSLMLWVCVAPFVLLLTVPFFGWSGGFTAAIIAFLIILAACWGICFFPKNSKEMNTHAH